MIKINITNNDINELRQLFIDNEVGEFFYFVKGKVKGKKVILENGEFIDL